MQLHSRFFLVPSVSRQYALVARDCLIQVEASPAVISLELLRIKSGNLVPLSLQELGCNVQVRALRLRHGLEVLDTVNSAQDPVLALCSVLE